MHLGLCWHLLAVILLSVVVPLEHQQCWDENCFALSNSNSFLTCLASLSVTGLSLLSLMMRRNATVLIIMSPVLASLSRGRLWASFWANKDINISGPLWSFSLSKLSLCPLLTVCSSHNQITRYLLPFRRLFFRFFIPHPRTFWTVRPHCIIRALVGRPCRKLCMM